MKIESIFLKVASLDSQVVFLCNITSSVENRFLLSRGAAGGVGGFLVSCSSRLWQVSLLAVLLVGPLVSVPRSVAPLLLLCAALLRLLLCCAVPLPASAWFGAVLLGSLGFSPAGLWLCHIRLITGTGKNLRLNRFVSQQVPL